jgi:hypothetical protein
MISSLRSSLYPSDYTSGGATEKTRAVGEIQTESHFAQFLEWSLAAAPL